MTEWTRLTLSATFSSMTEWARLTLSATFSSMTEWAQLTLSATFSSMTEWARLALSAIFFFDDRVSSVSTICYFFFDDRVSSVNTVCSFPSMTEWARLTMTFPSFLWWPSELGRNWLLHLLNVLARWMTDIWYDICVTSKTIHNYQLYPTNLLQRFSYLVVKPTYQYRISTSNTIVREY